jgi:preprotein translocase subunit SecG
MALFAVWPWVPPLFAFLLVVVSLFLILLILIQRGKGGGLAGAFGGAGGSSAFGSRAGDTFTKITIYVAVVWLLLIMLLIKMVQPTAPLQAQEIVQPDQQPGGGAPEAPEGG